MAFRPAPRFRLLKVLVIAITVLFFSVSAYFYFREASPEIKTETVRVKDIEESVLARGKLAAYRQVDVGAQASGRITKFYVDYGDTVRTNDLIAEIDSSAQQNSLKIAKAELQTALANKEEGIAEMNQAKLDFQRQQRMLKLDSTSKQDYELAKLKFATAQTRIKSLDASVNQAETKVGTAEVDLNYTKIFAPIDGTVVGIVRKEGQTVNSVQSAPTIVKIAQLEKMIVKVEIAEGDVVKIQPGMGVSFTILGEPQKQYRAKLKSIEPAPDSINQDESGLYSTSSTDTNEKAVYYIGTFDVPNLESKLRIDMTAQVSIILNSFKHVPVISLASLTNKNPDGTYTVKVMRESTKEPEAREIHTGIDDSIDVQIVDGLKAGEKILIESNL